jgi:membrane protein YqaA with SNARE-associated domain
MAALLFIYAFISNVALAVVPHEPVVIWYGPRLGIFPTALVATAGTVAASWVDHRIFATRIAAFWSRTRYHPAAAWFERAPFAVVAASGLTPLPFFPFKVMAFAVRYPLGRYLAAVATGRLPRYLLLAWLGAALELPTWPFVVAFGVLLLPALRGVRWQQRNEN